MSEAFERNVFSYYPHSFPHSFSKVQKLYFRKTLLKMNPLLYLFPGFFKRIYKNSTNIFEGFCENWKYLSLSYQNLGAAISMEHLAVITSVSQADVLLRTTYDQRLGYDFIISYCNTIATPSDMTEGKTGN